MTESDPAGSTHDIESNQTFWGMFFRCLDILKGINGVTIDEHEVKDLAQNADRGRAENFLFRSIRDIRPNEDEKDSLRAVFDFLFETGYLRIEPDTDPSAEI